MDTLSSLRILNLHRLVPGAIPILQKLKFLGKLLSFRGGDDALTLVNRNELENGTSFIRSFMSPSRCFILA